MTNICDFSIEHAEAVSDLLIRLSSFHQTRNQISSAAMNFVQDPNCIGKVSIGDDGAVTGFGSLIIYQRVRGSNFAILEDICVCPGFERIGLGKALVSSLLKVAWDRNCIKVSAAAQASNIPFYENVGFSEGGIVMRQFKIGDSSEA